MLGISPSLTSISPSFTRNLLALAWSKAFLLIWPSLRSCTDCIAYGYISEAWKWLFTFLFVKYCADPQDFGHNSALQKVWRKKIIETYNKVCFSKQEHKTTSTTTTKMQPRPQPLRISDNLGCLLAGGLIIYLD